MAFNQSLNANCNLNKYLFCRMPAGALEVQIKVKTTWGKFTMVQDVHTRMEKYHMWQKAQRCTIASRKIRTPHRMTSMQTEDDDSETDIPTGQGFGYPSQIFINHTQSTTSEGEWQRKESFLGRYCEFCDKCNNTHCWYSSCNWKEGLTDVNGTSSNLSIEKNPSLTVRKCPVGWSTFRGRVIREAELARPPSLPEEADMDSGINMQ